MNGWHTAGAIFLGCLLVVLIWATIVIWGYHLRTVGQYQATEAEYRKQRRTESLAMLQALQEVVSTYPPPGQPIDWPSVAEAPGPDGILPPLPAWLRRSLPTYRRARALLEALPVSQFELPITRGFIDPERYPQALAHLMRYMHEHQPVGETMDSNRLMRDELAAAITEAANNA